MSRQFHTRRGVGCPSGGISLRTYLSSMCSSTLVACMRCPKMRAFMGPLGLGLARCRWPMRLAARALGILYGGAFASRKMVYENMRSTAPSLRRVVRCAPQVSLSHGRHKVRRHILSAAPEPQVFLPATTAHVAVAIAMALCPEVARPRDGGRRAVALSDEQ